MTIKYKIDNDDLYRQYARLTLDYVQNIRDNDKGFYSDGLSYAATIKIDVLEDEHTHEILKDFAEILSIVILKRHLVIMIVVFLMWKLHFHIITRT